jgi:uncharacterized protein
MFSRQLISNIVEAMTDTPVILLSGARQTGKSTLMQSLVAPSAIANKSELHYLTLDDPEIYAAATSNPHGFIAAHAGTMLIDEVQRVPELFLAIKHAVDKDRRPGRFLLTGSANVLLLPRLSESLAGRMEILTLRPLSQMEIAQVEGVGQTIKTVGNLIDAWFVGHSHSSTLPTYLPVDRADFAQKLLVGGYPEVVARRSSKRRAAWFDSYLNTVLQRDIRDLAQIDAVLQMPRLLEAIAHRTTGTLNLADVSRTLGLPQTSLKRYLTLLETVYLIEPIQAWSNRDSHRAQKASKYYLNDSGLFAHVMGITANIVAASSSPMAAVTGLDGALVETFVQSELRKHLSWAETSAELMHYRTSTGIEVDFVLEDKVGNVIGIEVKSSLTVGQNDFKGLRHLQALLGDKFVRGIVLHPGEKTLHWDETMASIPMSCFWTV